MRISKQVKALLNLMQLLCACVIDSMQKSRLMQGLNASNGLHAESQNGGQGEATVRPPSPKPQQVLAQQRHHQIRHVEVEIATVLDETTTETQTQADAQQASQAATVKREEAAARECLVAVPVFPLPFDSHERILLQLG